jgi:hypothetical protein
LHSRTLPPLPRRNTPEAPESALVGVLICFVKLYG